MQNDIIELGGKSYDAKTGRQLNNAKAITKALGKASTLNRQYVKKPNLRPEVIAKSNDNRATKPEIRQFRRGIIAPGTNRPSAKNINHFNRGDFNHSHQAIILDIKPRPDIVLSAEQNQKFIDAVKRAEKTDLVRRYYANQISCSRRKQMDIVMASAKKLNRPTMQNKTTDKTDSQILNPLLKQARNNQIINQALANAPSSQDLRNQTPKSSLPNKSFLSRFIKTTLVLIALGLLAALVYLNWPNLSFNYAKFKLNFDAKLPAYVVENYKLDYQNKIQNGRLVLNYQNKQRQHYRIIQSRTSLDSQGVLINIVEPEAKDNYTVYRKNGLTIYFIAEHKAVWSNGGILYQVEANSNLDLNKLRQIVSSL